MIINWEEKEKSASSLGGGCRYWGEKTDRPLTESSPNKALLGRKYQNSPRSVKAAGRAAK